VGRGETALSLGVILLAGSDPLAASFGFGEEAEGADKNSATPMPGDSPLECVEILGRFMLDRQIDRFLESSSAKITVLCSSSISFPLRRQPTHSRVAFRRTVDLWSGAQQVLRDYSEEGITHALVMKAGTYAEFTLPDLIEFHRSTGRAVTGTCDSAGPLGMWIANCTTDHEPLDFLLSPRQNCDLESYFIANYTNRLEGPADFRRLVVDSFRGTCAVRPFGKEVRPGVFVAEGAEIHKRARVVAPAFVGRNSRLRQDTLVTRCSNIESGCDIDCGTAIEDSSILSNSYVGICLDIVHSVVQGKTLSHVGRDVKLQILDESVLRENSTIENTAAHEPLVAWS
jgi:hypothetical protein